MCLMRLSLSHTKVEYSNLKKSPLMKLLVPKNCNLCIKVTLRKNHVKVAFQYALLN